MLTFGSLFTGIGGLDLGLERAGMECKWQVEIDELCRRLLSRYWPGVRRYADVRNFCREATAELQVDGICGGFPCQDISHAGHGIGLDGARSGLWSEFARVIRVLRPRFVIVENVAALLVRGMGRVLGDLARLGFDAEWRCYRASQFGAPHIRDRLFIFGHQRQCSPAMSKVGNILADPGSESRWLQQPLRSANSPKLLAGCVNVATDWRETLYYEGAVHTGVGSWQSEPLVRRVDYGLPNWMDRRHRIGNAVVPDVAEWIGRSIVASAK